ncbi:MULTISPECIES: ABC transporter permease [Reinekea]|jgi:ABC-2 type transport system permease protein|uniref:Transport permease protein n=3 Tax=Reinekea TaxID=230494 RepID=A0A2K8KS14_9GAMM|nr:MULTISPECIES: ABC transporter permease [Reinekea]ATX77402.1 ABC-type multidrug transport system, permease component [Reinekea forsetii]MDO7643771.1 ABC transporter permease [Reinekea forsetii]
MSHPYWVAFSSIVEKEVKRFLRIWPQTLLPPAITMVLYFVIFGNLIGSRIGQMGGFDYMEFIVPGLIMMSVITNSYGNVSSSFFSNKFQRSLEELLVAPVPNWIILSGFVIGGVARGIACGAIVMVLSLWFADLSVKHLWVTVSVTLLTAIVFSLAGLINAVYATKFDDVTIVPTFILTPLTYLGGVFYSVSLLPDFWQVVSHLNPVLYMVNTFRYGIIGVSDIPIGFAFVMLICFVLALGGWALYLLTTGRGLRT